MMRIGTTYRKPLAWLMTLLVVFIILSPAALRADGCWDAFGSCISDLAAYALNPTHFMFCINGLLFCLAYLPA